MSLQILKNIHEIMQRVRRAGSTTTMLNAYTGEIEPFTQFNLVVHNQMYGEQLKKQFQLTNASIISLHSPDENFNPKKLPLAIDNGAFMHVVRMGIDGIESAHYELENLKKKVGKFDMFVGQIGNALKRFWPRHYDEKKWGHHYKEMDEYMRILSLAERAINWQADKFVKHYRNKKATLNALKYGRIEPVKISKKS